MFYRDTFSILKYSQREKIIKKQFLHVYKYKIRNTYYLLRCAFMLKLKGYLTLKSLQPLLQKNFTV